MMEKESYTHCLTRLVLVLLILLMIFVLATLLSAMLGPRVANLSSPAIIIAIIASLTALVVGILGPIVAIYTTNRQIKANVVSTSRMQWINSLRDSLAEALSICAYIATTPPKPIDNPGSPSDHRLPRDERLRFLASTISLMLDPNKGSHNQFLERVKAMVYSAGKALFSSDKAWSAETVTLAREINNVESLSKNILNDAWEIVKTE